MAFPKSPAWVDGVDWNAAAVNDLEARAAAAITSNVAGANGNGSANNLTALQAAIAANVNGTVTLGKGTFYVDNAASLTAGLAAATGTDLTLEGAGPGTTIIKFGPNGANAEGFRFWQINPNQTITFQNLTLQGPDTLGGTGPPPDPGIGSGSSCEEIFDDRSNAPGSLVRFVNCHVYHWTFFGALHAAVEGISTVFEGCGDDRQSMGPGGGDVSAYSPAKFGRFTNCRFTAFGDPTGGVHYHHIYFGTSADLLFTNCVFDTPATNSGGSMCIHYDGNVPFADAAKHAAYVNCLFIPGSQNGVLTSYNTTTKIIGCSFIVGSGVGILLAGPAIVDDCTFELTTNTSVGVDTSGQGQSTGLDWGLQMSNCRFKYAGAYSASGVSIEHANAAAGTSLGSEFVIADTVFEGDPSGDGNYIYHHVAGGRINVRGCTFLDHPSVAIRNAGTNVVTVDDCHFLMSAGLAIYQTTVQAELALYRSEFASGVGITLSTLPTVMRSGGNYGAGWTARNPQAGASYTCTPYEELVACTGTGSTAQAITFPAAASVAQGQEIVLVDEGGAAATRNITATPHSGDTIKGSAVISTNNGYGRWRSAGPGQTFWTRVG